MSEEKPVTVVRVDDVLNGRYHLKQKIGEGGMGSVYLAHDRELDREVAVKMLAQALVNDDEVVVRFEQEARMTARLDHPNIVPVYDVGRHLGRPFIVMKRLDGETLAGVLRNKGGFSPDETLAFMKQLAAGLDHIHQRGFIHRDIKAGNIFVGPNNLATILDFGILRSSHAGEGLTKTGVVMGTPHYMAPEQAMGSKDVDHRVDLYALAVVLFECLTGTLPFDADSELRLIQMQAHAPPPDLIERAPWIPKPVAEVVRRALAKRPDDRYASASELVHALEVALRESKGQPIPPPAASPASPPPSGPSSYQGPKDAPGTAPSWRRRNDESELPAPLPPSPAVFVPGTMPGIRLPPVAPPPVVADAIAPPRRSPLLFAAIGLVLTATVVLATWRPWQATDPIGVTQPPAVIDAGTSMVAALITDAGTDDEEDAGELAVAMLDAGAFDAGRLVRLPPLKPGNLSVLTSREGEPFWAQVYINGLEKGRTPLQLELNPGWYQVRVERMGFKTEQREIKVAPGKATVVRIDLTQ